MFQNFSDSEEQNNETNEEEIIEKQNKTKRILKQIFTMQNTFIYILTFMISKVGFGTDVLPFGIAIFAAACSNMVPSAAVFVIRSNWDRHRLW